jgi:hypothetical protein
MLRSSGIQSSTRRQLKMQRVAFQFAENHLEQDDDEDDSLWTVKWRRETIFILTIFTTIHTTNSTEK